MLSQRRTVRLIVSLGLGASALTLAPGVGRAAVATAPMNPLAVSIPQPKAAWSLDQVSCGTGTCVQLDRSTNQGTTWEVEHLPSALESWLSGETSYVGSSSDVQMHFFSALNGWIYGAQRSSTSSTSELWVTSNGGRGWSRVATTPRGMLTSILAVGVTRGNVYAVAWRDGQHFGLWRSPLTTNQWRLEATPNLPIAAGGSMMVGSLTFVGNNGWLTIGNDRGVTGAARMTASSSWVAMRPPCAAVGDSLAAPTPLTATTVVALCTIGGFGSTIDPGTPASLVLGTNWLYRSTNGGQSFVALRVVGRSTQNQLLGSSLAYGPHAPSLFLTRSVANSTGAILQRSTTMGASWQTEASMSSPTWTPQLTGLSLVQNFGGVIVRTSPTHTALWLTHDSGQHWSSLAS